MSPRYAEAWEAEVTALVLALVEAGVLERGEWSEALSRAAATAPDGVAGPAQWLAALEDLGVARGLVTHDEVAARAEAWRQAYLRTPHGKPVVLDDAFGTGP